MLEQKMREYSNRFNDGFPTIPLAWSRNDKELIGIIDECLSKGKDVYELGYVTDDEEIVY